MQIKILSSVGGIFHRHSEVSAATPAAPMATAPPATAAPTVIAADPVASAMTIEELEKLYSSKAK